VRARGDTGAGAEGVVSGTADRAARLRVLIVGGGIAGLALAAALRQQGLRPLVVERATGEGDEG